MTDKESDVSLESLLAKPSIMRVHVSFCGHNFDADLLKIDETGSMSLRVSPTEINWLSINYAKPIDVTREIIENFKSVHWDHEHNHLDIGYLKVYDWLISGLHKTKTLEINTELTNDEAELTQVSTIRSDKKIRRKPVELSIDF